MTQGRKRVLFIEPVLAHYRHDTFSFLLNSNLFESFLLAGTDYENIKESELNNVIKNRYIKIKFGFIKFYYLRKTLHFVRKYKPDIIVCSGVDFRHIHTLLAFLLAKFLKIKFLWWSHAGLGNQGKLGQKLRSIFYRPCEGILVYSNKGKQNLVSIGVPENKIKIIGNALNSIEYGFNSNMNNESNESVLLFSGRITREKKLDVLIKALKVLKDKGINFRCFVVGGGKISYYQQLAKDLGITDRINFLGPKYGEELKQYFSKAQLFVYPGGIGLSLVQALSYGLPVITTDAFGLHGPEIELITPGVTGDLFREGDYEDLASKIEYWLKRLVTDKYKIAHDCRKRIMEYGYLPEIVSQKIIEFIAQVQK